jgi:hypothetical protein
MRHHYLSIIFPYGLLASLYAPCNKSGQVYVLPWSTHIFQRFLRYSAISLAYCLFIADENLLAVKLSHYRIERIVLLDFIHRLVSQKLRN